MLWWISEVPPWAVGEETVSLIEHKGARAAFAMADVTDGEQMSATLQSVLSRFNRFDILFNNAGNHLPPPGFPRVPIDVWRRCSTSIFKPCYSAAIWPIR
jgi:NAD(P)-dependent dehydrogenase (short-subunit alcohol dehydrogenase family)